MNLFRYAGSKTLIADWIISHFPHNYTKLHYIEPFGGALAVLLSKNPSIIESISDTNKNIYYLYKALRDDYDKLIHKIDNTMYCEETYREVRDIYKGRVKVDYIKQAWAVYTMFEISFGGKGNAYGYKMSTQDVRSNKAFYNKQSYLISFNKRLKNIQIFNRPADWFVNHFKDFNDVFMYLDPPYPESTQDTYIHSFTMDDFNIMIDKLCNVSFKWALSFYEKEGMQLDAIKHSSKYRFLYKNTKTSIKLDKNNPRPKRMECLIINYPSNNQQNNLF